MGTVKRWSRAHLLGFVLLETWTCGPKLIFMAVIYAYQIVNICKFLLNFLLDSCLLLWSIFHSFCEHAF